MTARARAGECYDPAEVRLKPPLRGFGPGVLVIAAALALVQQPTNAQNLAFSVFERYLESLRLQAGIPGLSAIIVQDGRVAWERGFGYADVEKSLAALPDTPYPIVDITQTFASVLLLQCEERGTLRLDDPLSTWSGTSNATVGQTLAHATAATGNGFRYDPRSFAQLTSPVEACGGQPARLRLAGDIFDRLAMRDSVPGRDLDEPGSPARLGFDAAHLDRYTAVLRRMAVPYKVDKRGKASRSDYANKQIDASTGLVSTTRDLSRYDSAIDGRDLLHDSAVAAMWSNVSQTGAVRPTGLGWFVQTYNGERLVWHFGYAPDAYSSLILKIPSRRLTLILLANSDGLSAPFDLSHGDVTSSLFALTFLRLFL
jgi:CubicO group peptidase (beta-lactamase class C family)